MIALYERVSTSEQAEHGHSIEEQIDRLEKYAAALDLKCIKHYTDAGFSGANTDRPELQKLLKDVERGLVEKVIVYKLDRLSRSQKDTLTLIEDHFLANGCDFLSVCENFDTSSPFGRAMIGILAVFAQLEREQIKERMAMGHLARAKKGKFHGSKNVPIGYDYIDGDLVVNEYEKMQVVRIFEEFSAGVPLNRIVRELNAEGYVTKYGKWHHSTAMEVLKRKTYIGMIVHRGNVFDGLHDPLISEEMYDNVQTMLHRRQEAFDERGIRCGKATSALGGILICKHCGRKMSKVPARKKYMYYSCRNSACTQKARKMSEMDELVFSEVRKLSLECHKTPPKMSSGKNTDRKILEGKMSEIDRKIDRLIDLFTLDDAPKESLQTKLAELNAQKVKIERQMDSLEDPDPFTEQEAADIAGSLDRVLRSEDIDQIRAVISALIDKIEVDGEDITIFWRFS